MNTNLRHRGCDAGHRNHPGINVTEPERMASVIGGGIILLGMIRYGSVRSLIGTLVGAGLLYRGITGHCDMYAALDAAQNSECGEWAECSSDRIDAASDESFPASDPPAWTSATAT